MKSSIKHDKRTKQASPKMASFQTNLCHIMMGLSAFTLLACSSGGGNETPSSSNPSTNSYSPNAERLLEEATNSNELYVEADFRFDQNQTTRLSILATDDTGKPLPYTRLNIYLIDTSQMEGKITEWSDTNASKAHLISGGLTNNQGEFIRVIELPASDQTTPVLLIEVNAMGFENKTLVPITSEHTAITLGSV